MLLASVANIRTQFGFDDMTDINDEIRGALQAAEPYLSVILQTSFLFQTSIDTFFVLNPGHVVQNHCQTEFKLRHGLVGTVLEVATVNSINQFGTGDVRDIGAVMALSSERGVLMDYQTWYDRQFVRVTYTSGFMPASSDPAEESYDLLMVPPWLQEVATQYAVLQLAGGPSFEQAGITVDRTSLRTQIDAILSGKRRYAPVALDPL